MTIEQINTTENAENRLSTEDQENQAFLEVEKNRERLGKACEFKNPEFRDGFSGYAKTMAPMLDGRDA